MAQGHLQFVFNLLQDLFAPHIPFNSEIDGAAPDFIGLLVQWSQMVFLHLSDKLLVQGIELLSAEIGILKLQFFGISRAGI